MSQKEENEKVRDPIIEWINSMPNCKAKSLHTGLFGRKGEPDIYGCFKGKMFVIECKLLGKSPEDIQYKRLREWSYAGAVSFWACSLDEVKNRFRQEGWI